MKTPILPVLAFGAALSAFGQAPDTLKGNLTASYTLDDSQTWYLSGFVAVDSPHVLTILPGAVIKGIKATQGTLAIKPGARIIAEGTAEEPITFTSDEPDSAKTRGSWGGIVILGRAKTNKGATDKFEGKDDWSFGGSDDDDSSGVFKYVRLEAPGFPVAPDKELNGVTMGGVGRKTVISHVQVHRGDDDGFEWFGGSVNADHLVVTNQVDDAFDSDNGFSGKVSWSINLQSVDGTRTRVVPRAGLPDTNIIETVGDRCFESSSTKLTAGTAPETRPTWSNITCVDNGKSGGPIILNEHAQGIFEKSLFIGDSSAFAVSLQSSGTNTALLATSPGVEFRKSYLGGTFKTRFLTSDSANKTVILALLDASLKSLDKPLYRDLSPNNDTLIRDTVGAVLTTRAEDHWYSGWTFDNSLVWSKGEEKGSIGIRRAPASPALSGEILSARLSGGSLLLTAAFAMPVSVEILDMSGRRVFVREGIKLSRGENAIARPWGRLNAGSYFLAVRSGDLSVHYRIDEAGK